MGHDGVGIGGLGGQWGIGIGGVGCREDRIASTLEGVAGEGDVIGGAAGNVIDRLYYGAVADLLDFHVGQWHWPAFNLADSAIVRGVAVLMVDAFIAAEE